LGETGVLYLVATPIGNLEDITLRALRVLKEADIIAAEDTRQTLKLLNHFDIKKPLVSYYGHNMLQKGEYLIQQLLEGKNVAVVSDAGSPGISDPGEDLVRLAIKHNMQVTMIPGPVAAVTGLVLSGLPAGRFVFEGFLPMNKRARRQRIQNLANETRTIVLYEAPHKLVHTLRDLYEYLGDRKIALARELTKMYEEVIRCTLREAVERFTIEAPRGEFVLVMEGADKKLIVERERKDWSVLDIKEHIQIYLDQGLDRKEAMKRAAEDRGITRREVYRLMLDNRDS
jgi:16S rRNA (cytidine1402-2'-O)-methyltransferase